MASNEQFNRVIGSKNRIQPRQQSRTRFRRSRLVHTESKPNKIEDGGFPGVVWTNNAIEAGIKQKCLSIAIAAVRACGYNCRVMIWWWLDFRDSRRWLTSDLFEALDGWLGHAEPRRTFSSW
jgi:hypothetical protein